MNENLLDDWPDLEIEDAESPGCDEDLASLPNDIGRATRFINAYHDELRYVPEWDAWLTWTGNRWERDRDRAVWRYLKQFCLDEFKAAMESSPDDPRARFSASKEAASMGDATRAEKVLKMARSDSRVIVHPEMLDANPLVLGTGNGVIDLETGEFRAGARDDLITKATGALYDPQAACPRFERFLSEVFCRDDDLVEFIKRAIGYSLSGCMDEQVFFFLYGRGANGKSRFVEAMLHMLGDYGGTTAPEVVALSGNSTPQHHLAALHGLRMVTLAETENDKRLAESQLKAITAGDEISACRKYEHPFSFRPTCKMWMHGNHKPEIRGADNGIWRRVKLVPFEAHFPPEAREEGLLEKLYAEASGILNLAVAGFQQWRQRGLGCPAKVKAATDTYREEQDILADFLEDCTLTEPGALVERRELYKRYEAWAANQGVQRLYTPRTIAASLRERGVEEFKSGGCRYWRNLRLK